MTDVENVLSFGRLHN